MSSFLSISTRFSENQFFTIVFDIQNLICITMSHRDDLLCYSRGKLCLLNMFLASSGTLDALFARYGRFLWRNVSSEVANNEIFCVQKSLISLPQS